MPSASFLSVVRGALRSAGVGPQQSIVVACSGGPDSTALLLSLCALSGELDLQLHGVYIDHGLRPEAAQEGARVRALCDELQVPAEVVAVTVGQGPSLQAAARAARYAALTAVAQRTSAPFIAVGHSASDQAETLLMRLLGGAGLRGLAGMAPARPLGPDLVLLRPLLSLDRPAICAFLADAGLEAISDPSNEDRRHLRARVRHDLLPLLRRERPDLDRHLSDLCGELRQDSDCLEQIAADALPALAGEGLSAMGLLSVPLAVQARVLQRTCGPLSRRQLRAARALCAGSGTKSLDLPGRRLVRRYDRLLVLSPPPVPETPPGPVPIPGPGSYRLGPHTVRIGAPSPLWAPPPGPPGRNWAPLAVSPPLLLRPPRPGDRIRLAGGHRKISDLLIDAKVPREKRRQVALLCCGEEVLWVVGLRACAGPAAGPVSGAIAPLFAELLDPPGDPHR